MKKLLSVLLAAAFLLLFTACATEPAGPSQMQLAPGNLTDEEKNLLTLVGSSQTASLFDFQLDDSIQSVNVERYELDANGAWRSFGGGSFSVSAGEGRIALSLDPRRNEIRFAVQGEGGTSALQHEYPVDDFADMAISTTILSEPVDIVAGQEIPLLVQVLTRSNEVYSYSVEEFFTPESYAQHDYEHVYAVTVTFLADDLA